jgi:hypothetical protein
MKKLLLTMVLILAVAIPAFAQHGPVKIKSLMAYATNDDYLPTPIFYLSVDQNVIFARHWEIKGSGLLTGKVEVRDSAGVLIYKFRSGPFSVDYTAFEHQHADTYLSIGTSIQMAGYYTVKSIYRDVATGNTWSQQIRIHVMEP